MDYLYRIISLKICKVSVMSKLAVYKTYQISRIQIGYWILLNFINMNLSTKVGKVY